MKRLFSLSTFVVVFSLLLASVMARQSIAEANDEMKTALRKLNTAQAKIAEIRKILSSGRPPSAADVLYINIQREIVISNMQALKIKPRALVRDRQQNEEDLNERDRVRLAIDIALLKVDAEANRYSHTQLDFNEKVARLRAKTVKVFHIVRGPSGKALQELVQAIDRIPRVDENENDLIGQRVLQLDAIRTLPDLSSSGSRSCESAMKIPIN